MYTEPGASEGAPEASETDSSSNPDAEAVDAEFEEVKDEKIDK